MPYNRKAFSDDYATETFYFPLSVQVEDSEDLYNVSSDSVRWFEDEIQEAIDDYQSDIEMERYLCDDNEEIQRSVVPIRPDDGSTPRYQYPRKSKYHHNKKSNL